MVFTILELFEPDSH